MSFFEEKDSIVQNFYIDYKNAQLTLFYHLIEQSTTIEKLVLLEKAQKIIDRLIFILFCEDTGNLLPRNLVKDTYELLEEFEKQKIKLDLKQKDQLNIWFRSKQNEAVRVNTLVEKLQKEINLSIYDLFALNGAEIRLIES